MKLNAKKQIIDLVSRYHCLEECKEALMTSTEFLIDCFRKNHKLLICGNGGSSADALHIVGELMKSFVLPRPLEEEIQERIMRNCQNGGYLCKHLQSAFPAIALSAETALITAYANDEQYDLAYAQQVCGYGNPGDVLLAISTSGNSANIVYACEIAKVKGMKVVALTGKTGGKLRAIADCNIVVPENSTYKIQELHLPVYHAICMAIEEEFWGDRSL